MRIIKKSFDTLCTTRRARYIFANANNSINSKQRNVCIFLGEGHVIYIFWLNNFHTYVRDHTLDSDIFVNIRDDFVLDNNMRTRENAE